MVTGFRFPEISFVIISEPAEKVKHFFDFFAFFLAIIPLRWFYLKIWKNCMLFYTGGAVYLTIELLYRGRSYGSMFLAGGICFLLIGHLNRVKPKLPLLLRAVVGAGIVTMVELAAGLLVNRGYAVWDYRGQPGNFMGQICPLFSALWFPLSLAAAVLFQRMDTALEKKGSPD